MSIQPLKMPQLGLGDGEVEVRDWLLEPGAEFGVGDPILEVETDKAVVEVEAPVAGVLVECLFAEGATVTPGTVIAYLAEPGTSLADARVQLSTDHSAADPDESESGSSGGALLAQQPSAVTPSEDGASPALVSVTSGALAGIPDPRTAGVAGASTVPPPSVAQLDDREVAGAGTERRLSRRRRSIAQRTVAAISIPTFTVTRELEADGLRRAVAAFREHGLNATVTDLLLSACGTAGRAHPMANAWLLDETVIEFEHVNVALAVDAPDGVIAPVVREVEALDVPAIAEQRAGLVERARSGRSDATELLGGTTTLSNVAGLGAHGIRPVISVPQVIALGVGMARAHGEREILDVCLVGDHRVLDGADGARYLASFADAIEESVASPTG